MVFPDWPWTALVRSDWSWLVLVIPGRPTRIALDGFDLFEVALVDSGGSYSWFCACTDWVASPCWFKCSG